MAGRDRALRITGGAQLAGKVCVSGSKNAALPEMAAALLTTDRVTLHNVPKVTDTHVMAEIIEELGGRCEGDGTVLLNTGAAVRSDVPDQLGARMRATIVLLGALLGQFGKTRVPRPGGDDIGARRVEQHLRGLRQMGASINETEDEIVATAERLHGDRVVFDLPTVTGTENILLAAVKAEGRTEIFNAAREPHVEDLCRLLTKMGARIEGIGTERLIVDGMSELRGSEHTVIAEYVHENRFQHVRELAKMGAGITVEGRLHAIVHGPCRLRGTEVAIPDIRSGAALVIAALCAEGDSLLRNAWHVERGYEDMVGKLSSVGARIKSVRLDSEAAAGHRL